MKRKWRRRVRRLRQRVDLLLVLLALLVLFAEATWDCPGW